MELVMISMLATLTLLAIELKDLVVGQLHARRTAPGMCSMQAGELAATAVVANDPSVTVCDRAA